MEINDIKVRGEYFIQENETISIRVRNSGNLQLVSKTIEKGTRVRVVEIIGDIGRVVKFNIHTRGYFHQNTYAYPIGLFAHIVDKIIKPGK